jgi:ribosomal protein S18 acetylase RimI-like enzyme
MEIVTFAPSHLEGILRLTTAEGWPTLAADRERAVRVLTAPGAATVVAIEGGEVVGFARALTDGEWIACLTDMVIEARLRRRGIGRALIAEIFVRSGAQRMDLLAEPGSEDFYRSFPHQGWAGFRLYPTADGGPYPEKEPR